GLWILCADPALGAASRPLPFVYTPLVCLGAIKVCSVREVNANHRLIVAGDARSDRTPLKAVPDYSLQTHPRLDRNVSFTSKDACPGRHAGVSEVVPVVHEMEARLAPLPCVVEDSPKLG